MELNHPYTMKEVAEFNGVSYATYRNKREQYEEHMKLFFEYIIEKKGRSYYYTFLEQKDDFILYKDFYSSTRSKVIRTEIKKVITKDPRQRGSNIARIIIINGETQTLGLADSTITKHTYIELKRLVSQGYYVKDDYRWCILNHATNVYELMSEAQVEELRSYFRINHDANLDNEENILFEQKEGNISKEEAYKQLGELRMSAMIDGMKKFQAKYNAWPIKVPVYIRNALVEEEK